MRTGCGSPRCASSSRRLWHRSMPPMYATSSCGRSRWRSTTSFWWCEPSGRTRMSSRHWPPAASISSPRCRFSAALNRNRSQCERQTSPRTSTPRPAAAANTWPTSVPGPSRRSSGSPRQSVNSSRSPGPIALTAASRAVKYVAPCTSGVTWFPSVHQEPSGCRESSVVSGLPRSPGARNQWAGSAGRAVTTRGPARRRPAGSSRPSHTSAALPTLASHHRAPARAGRDVRA